MSRDKGKRVRVEEEGSGGVGEKAEGKGWKGKV